MYNSIYYLLYNLYLKYIANIIHILWHEKIIINESRII